MKYIKDTRFKAEAQKGNIPGAIEILYSEIATNYNRTAFRVFNPQSQMVQELFASIAFWPWNAFSLEEQQEYFLKLKQTRRIMKKIIISI